MDSTNNTYQKVAQHCQEFCPCKNCSTVSNSTSECNDVSCLNCDHFDISKTHCNLDLYDKIVGRI